MGYRRAPFPSPLWLITIQFLRLIRNWYRARDYTRNVALPSGIQLFSPESNHAGYEVQVVSPTDIYIYSHQCPSYVSMLMDDDIPWAVCLHTQEMFPVTPRGPHTSTYRISGVCIPPGKSWDSLQYVRTGFVDEARVSCQGPRFGLSMRLCLDGGPRFCSLLLVLVSFFLEVVSCRFPSARQAGTNSYLCP